MQCTSKTTGTKWVLQGITLFLNSLSEQIRTQRAAGAVHPGSPVRPVGCPQLLPCQGQLAYVCTENQASSCASIGQKLWKALGQLSPSSEHCQSTAVLACGTAPWAQMGSRKESIQAAASGCCAAAAGSSHCVGASLALATSPFMSWGSGQLRNKEIGITMGSALRRTEL